MNLRYHAHKPILFCFSCLFAAICLFASPASASPDSDYEASDYDAMMDRTAWHRDARFGMFIHWGPYSVAARGEWVKSIERMTTEDYQKYVDAFVPKNYHPEQWAALAKEAGMKYAVMTAKHHDGFCLFDSEYTDYKVTARNDGRDFVEEYLEAFRDAGLKVGLYYSLIDWHHPDYPTVGNHPQRGEEEPEVPEEQWQRYLDYMFNQLEELMTQYGKIDVLWLDYSFDDYAGERWRATELIEMIRKHQPDIIVNNRLAVNHGASGGTRYATRYGDFETPELGIPDAGLKDGDGRPIPWETCLTLNNSWGYSSTDNQWKTVDQVIHALANCVSKNGNLLLNVGPDSQGTIPVESVKILREVGKWMEVNGESIYGCGASDDFPKPEWGYLTQNGNDLYLHWANPIIGPLNLKGFDQELASTKILASDKPAVTSKTWWGNRDAGNFWVNIDRSIWMTLELPDPVNTVIRLSIE